jgi:hypothetical protein
MKNATLPQCFFPPKYVILPNWRIACWKNSFFTFSNGFPSFLHRKVTKIMKLSYPKKHCFGNITNFQMIVNQS